METKNSIRITASIFISTVIFANSLFAQQNWKTGGNPSTGLNAATAISILGTMSAGIPLNIYSANVQRAIINPTYTASGSTAQPVINGVGWPQINTSGYFGISPSGYFSNHPVATLLHLYGSNNTNWTSAGWRKWMQSGILINENSDAMYVGLKSEGNNRSDAIIGWNDDVGNDGSSNGADKLRFVFTT